ncbi:TcdA/TcdB pore-forming domain-containing protein [Photorhabdus kayaii]|uniref:TcdA/TcdB pore-forming domain-containing protein n=1 Tax=Photorhabdus kayaii TaxID=230088 RepID=UPI0021D50940|nr:TcdA/TcdB pore-forming domain-containing protein [Photorhabdus kayaii]MCT8352637.1 T3SS effector HopA1 family protein [Photorhabdus kayaii]
MPSNSYQSLLTSAQTTFREMRSKPKIQMLVQEIKKGFRENGRKWSPELLQQQKMLERALESNAYWRYSNDRPVGISSLDKSEQLAFVSYIKTLATRITTIDILVQGNEKTALSSQTDDALGNAEAFRMLPKDFAQRYDVRGKLGARLTINVNKAHFNLLARALPQLFNDDNRGWLEQAKIMGPKNLGSRTDQAVIYLSRAGVEHAQTISSKLSELLPATAFVEHTPTGMYRVGKGISYSETAEGGSSSHGQSRAQLIAAAGTQSLLTDIPIEKALTYTLQMRGYDVHIPALLSQALRDSELKGKLVPMSGGFEPRQSSADIHQFTADPVLFAKSNTISAETLIKSGSLPAEGNAQLVKIRSGLYELEYTDRGANDDVATSVNNIPAYFLNYDSADQANASPAYVDIPKHEIAESFLFTGTLSGGSVVVTSLDANTYRVYHDGRVNSSLLYDNVVMAVDYKDYRVAATTKSLAVAYMQYVNGEWQLVFQRQEYQQDGQMSWTKLRGGEEPLSIQIADSQVVKRNQAQFATYREQVHQQLKKVAAQFGVSVEGITDGVYTEGEFSPDHPAIAAWIQLHAEVDDRINADIKQLVDKRSKLYEEQRNTSQHNLIDQQIKQIDITLEYYKAQYDTVLREAGFVEQSWLWQQIKSKDGMAAVVRIDNTPIQNGGPEHTSSVGERYAIAEAYQHRVYGTTFTDGQRNFRDISIPGMYDRMSALEMKILFLKGQLTSEQQGALSAHITETSQAEYIDKVLKWTAVYSEGFHRAGSSFDRLVPQDFYLSLVGDKSGGRCYPLVRAMAVALANSGEAGINSLVEKLFLAAADPHANNSTLLKNSLIKLHSDNVEAVQASTVRGKVKLSEAVSLLKKTTKTSTFALNTPNHSMMVGSTVGLEGRRYYFYDPNVGIFAFNSTSSFFQAMKNHLVGRKLAAHYGSLGSELAPIFNLVEIDASKMAKVPVGNDLNVADLTRPDELTTVIEQRRQVEQAVNTQVRIAKDTRLHTALAILDAEQWGSRFAEASTRIAQENNLDQRWMPVIGNTEDQGKGHYRIQFINRDQPEETRWVSSSDATFIEFRRFIDEHVLTLGQHFTLEHGQIQPKGGIGEAAPVVDGLNAGFAIQTLIQWFADKNRNDAARGIASPDLSTALKVHSYINFVQMAHSGVQDVTKVSELVRTALRGEVVAAETSLKDFTSILGHTVNEGAGVLFGGAMVGLDAYELAHAENDGQKAVFGTQLAFDSASFVTGTAGVGAGLVGASTAGAVLGSGGVILGGLAVGFTALAQAFGAVAEDAKAVGHYFNTLDNAYKGNGYRYDNEKKVLVPLAGAVIKTLDLRKNQIDFDSQYIYRTHSGFTGSGRINYFFWIGDFPKMVHDRSQAIEVRSGIGYKDVSHKLDHSDSNVLILPGTPKSFISYEYMQLPSATTRHDAGFDVIRRLEEDKRFDYDFYIFPGEVTIRRIHQEYMATPIEVVLDQRNRQLIVPELPKELHGYLHYEIKGAGGEYLIGLNESASVKLTSDVPHNLVGSAPSRWIIDSSQLASDSISVSKNRLVVGGVVVELDSDRKEQVLVVNCKGEVREVDFSNLTTQVVSEDASKWQVPGHSIEQHLSDLAKAHQLHGQYVVVENYRYNERNVGRAFYDVAKDRMLFTDTPHKQARHAQLGAVMGDHAYFYDADNAAAWRVDIATGQVDAQFEPWFNQSAGQICRLWQEGNAVYLARRYQLKGKEAELSYRLLGDRMELVSAVGDDALLQLSARTGLHSDELKTILQGYENDSIQRETPTYTLGARLIQPTSAALVTVFGVDAAGVAHRYWIRTGNGTLMLIKPNLAPPADQTLHFEAHEQARSAWPIPADLVLAGSIPLPTGTEVFFFYSKEQKALFRQEGPGQTVLNANHPSALRISTPALANLVNLNGSLLAITEDGRVARLDAQGQLNYEAVNEHWLKGRTHWWQDLANITDGSTTLAVFGIKGTDGKNLLPVWYHNGQVVVASAALQGKSLQLLGFEMDSPSALLFEPESGKLYRQLAMTEKALTTAFGGANLILSASARLPTASELTPKLHLKEARQVDTGIRLITVKGEILLRTNNGELQLVGVDKDWRQNNQAQLPQALTKLADQWQAKGTLTLQDNKELGWFDIDSGQVFWGNGIPVSNNLRFVGIAAGEKTAYVYSPMTQALYQIKDGSAQMLNRFTSVERIGSSLLLQGGVVEDSKDDLTPPLIDGVDSVVLHGGTDSDTYRLSRAIWSHYRTIVIDNDDQGQALDRLILPLVDPESILVNRHDDDLMLTDSSNGTALIVRQVFDSQAMSHRHLQIELEGSSSVINVDHLVEGFTQWNYTKEGLMELSWASKQPVITTHAVVAVPDTEGPSLVKLSGAMASFPDTGGARDHLPQIRPASQAMLTSSLIS